MPNNVLIILQTLLLSYDCTLQYHINNTLLIRLVRCVIKYLDERLCILACMYFIKFKVSITTVKIYVRLYFRSI